MKKRIFVTTEFSALHCWPDAPEDVVFLRHPHRHLFKVRIECEITADRGLEFFQVQRLLKQVIGKELIPQLVADPSHSCERMAEFLLSRLNSQNCVSVSVSEDGENGSIVYYP